MIMASPSSWRLLSLLTLLTVSFHVVEAFENFPLSTRQALTQTAKDLNNNPSATTASTSTVVEPTWSNRAGKILTPVDDNVYAADRPFLWNSIDVGGRMAIIQLPSSSDNKNNKPDLWVQSPIGLDEPTLAALNQLGAVRYVVAPNYEHLKYSPTWNRAFPQAEMWACPGLMERMTNVQWQGEIPSGIRPAGWKGSRTAATDTTTALWDTNTIEALHIDIEKNPFTGKPFFNEVIFYHKPTKSLITTDFFWNYPGDAVPNKEHGQDDRWELAPLINIPFKTLLWKFGMDQIYKPFYKQLMVTDSQAYQDICRHILDEWQVETIIPAHGDIVRGKELCRKVLQKFLE